jgi:hypothetical protein
VSIHSRRVLPRLLRHQDFCRWVENQTRAPKYQLKFPWSSNGWPMEQPTSTSSSMKWKAFRLQNRSSYNPGCCSESFRSLSPFGNKLTNWLLYLWHVCSPIQGAFWLPLAVLRSFLCLRNVRKSFSESVYFGCALCYGSHLARHDSRGKKRLEKKFS